MVTYRLASSTDAEAIAQLHARSWQQHYRGILRDHYLDHAVEADRWAVWRERLQHPTDQQRILIATEDKQPIGLACTYLDHDPRWGALLDNLHVAAGQQGRGLGRTLMQRTAQWVNRERPRQGLYLWVYEENTAARAFYERMGGQRQETATVENPGGGRASVLRYAWSDLMRLERLE